MSNDNGILQVYDIAIDVAPPTLTATPESPQRGDTVTFEVKGAPGGSISDWVFTSPDGSVSRQSSSNEPTWTGTLVTSGTATVQVAIYNVNYDPSKAVQVTARDWMWVPVGPQEVPNGTVVTLPSPPIPNGQLGYSRLLQPYEYSYETIEDYGPNHGFKYLLAVQNYATFNYQISPDLENTGSTFFQAQCGDYDPRQRPSGYISGAQLLANTQEHEYGSVRGHYQQYSQAQDDPANNVAVGAEGEIGGPSLTVDDFKRRVETDLDARVVVIAAAMSLEACNSDVRDDTSCVFRGNINFSPYTPCQ